MKESMKMIRNMVMACLNGLRAISIKDNTEMMNVKVMEK